MKLFTSRRRRTQFLQSSAGTGLVTRHQILNGMTCSAYWEHLVTLWIPNTCARGPKGWAFWIYFKGLWTMFRKSLIYEDQHHRWGAGGALFCDPDEESGGGASDQDL